tara:strand:+ start:20 stop:760 length:741 start_codon:yes stop_codon:yes gene_type:complete
MSVLTDFFPATGGGGGNGLVSSPREMTGTWIAAGASATLSNFQFKYAGISDKINVHNTSFITDVWNNGIFDKSGYYTYVTADVNTYKTLVDITSTDAPYGGVFNGAYSPMTNLTEAQKIHNYKITIDGTEYIITAETPTGQNLSQRLMTSIGNFPMLPGGGLTSETQVYQPTIVNAQSWFRQSALYRGWKTNNFTYTNYNAQWNLPSIISLMGGMPFKETLKVELQVNDVYVNSGRAVGAALLTVY